MRVTIEGQSFAIILQPVWYEYSFYATTYPEYEGFHFVDTTGEVVEVASMEVRRRQSQVKIKEE